MTMGQALYRKYRSRSFSEVVGQDHITKTLQRAIKNGKISHAYLFTGPRGVGKTSVARILAHEVNGLPYDDDSMHLDIIEIDAASNRRIDEIRELRDKVHVTPAVAKYKVYIIDEVHMLTREAFNALLKTLEEPPAHCIFILATTESHKLPETIISRTQRFAFKPIDKEVAAKHLGYIAKKEKISITESALLLLAEHGQGSFRDSTSLLDQLSTNQEKITDDSVRNLLGLPPNSATQELVDNINNGRSAELLKSLESLFDQGTDASAIAKELGAKLRTDILNGRYSPWTGKLLRELLGVGASISPKDYLEIALLEAASKNTTPKIISEKPKSTSGSLKVEEPPKIIQAATDQDFDLAGWPVVVNYAKNHAASLYTALKLAKPEFSGGTLTLFFEFALHQKKLNTSSQRELIGQMIEGQLGTKVKIECVVNKELFKNSPSPKKQPLPEKENIDPIKSVSSIFGNVEMLS